METVVIDVDGRQTTGTILGAGSCGVLLAHGAGAGQESEWMMFFRDELAGTGLTVMSFDYLYMAAGRRRPDQLPALVACHRAALEVFRDRVESVFLAGKSMGGRVGGHLAAEEEVAGVIFYGYPLVPIGKTEPRDTSHLGTVPTLFASGTRDRMGPVDLIRATAANAGADLVLIEDGDHSFKVRKSSGRPTSEAWREAVAATSAWISQRC